MVEINVIGEFNPALENKFTKDIAVLKKGDVALFNVTSHGGEVEVLKRMKVKVDALKQQGVTIATFVPEYADSAGFFFFLLGDHREIAQNATVHYHAPRVEFTEGFIGTKQNMTEILDAIVEDQEFTNSIFRDSCSIEEDLFSIIENSELPMRREHLQTLGIIKIN